MSKRKDLKDIRKQKDAVLERMSQFHEYGDDYKHLLKRYQDLVVAEETILKGYNERANNGIGTVVKIAGLAISAVAGIGVPVYLANKAYDEEADLKLKNGTVWNLIGKSFGPKQ